MISKNTVAGIILFLASVAFTLPSGFAYSPEINDLASRENIDSFYQKAQEFYYKKDYVNAKDGFRKVLSLDPRHEYAATYLELSLINLEKISYAATKVSQADEAAANKELQTLYEKGKAAYYDRQYEQAKATFRKIYDAQPDYEYSLAYIELCNNKLGVKEQMAPAQKEQAAAEATSEDKRYETAKDAYYRKDYPVAKKAFEELYAQGARYKHVLAYIQLCNDKLGIKEAYAAKKERGFKTREEIMADYCSKGREFLAKGDYNSAKEMFNKALNVDPGYKDASGGVILCEKSLRAADSEKSKKETLAEGGFLKRVAKEKAQREKLDAEKLKTLYAEAESLYAQEDYRGSVRKFGEITALSPKDKKAEEYLRKSEAQIMIAERLWETQMPSYPRISFREIKFSSSVSLSVEYQDNVELVAFHKKEQLTRTITPSFSLSIPISNMAVDLGYSIGLRYVNGQKLAISPSLGARIKNVVRYQPCKTASFEIGQSYNRSNIDTERLDVILGSSGYRETTDLFLNVRYLLSNALSLSFGDRYSIGTIIDPKLTTAPRDTTDNKFDAGLEFQKNLGQRTSLSAGYVLGNTIANGNRDNTTADARFGINYALAGDGNIGVTLNYLAKSYYITNTKFENLTYGLTFSKPIFRKDRLGMGYEHSTPESGKSYFRFKRDSLNLSLMHIFNPATSLGLTGEYVSMIYDANDFTEPTTGGPSPIDAIASDRKAETFGFGLSLMHTFSKWTSGSLNYKKDIRKSDFEDESYVNNIYTVSINSSF